MLTPDKIKPFLLHEDRYIRRAALEYFENSCSTDPDLIPITLEIFSRFGKKNSDGITAASGFLLTEPALEPVLNHLENSGDPREVDYLNGVLVRAPGPLLLGRRSEILKQEKLSPASVMRIQRRCDLVAWSGERLWNELQDYARRSEDKPDTGEIDFDYVDDLIDALSPFDVPDVHTLCELLRSLRPEEGWLEIFVTDLAGARRLPQAVPALVEKFQIDTDYLLERSEIALARIGDPEAVLRIAAAFPDAPEHFKIYTPDLLGAIKHEVSEKALLSLLEHENDLTIRTLLCMALCELFSRDGIDVVLREIASGYDTTMTCLEDHLLPVAAVLGVELPDAKKWTQAREREEKRLAAHMAGLESLDREFRAQELERKASPLNRYAGLQQNDPATDHSSLALTTPIRRTTHKVGRNDPCPCGSGKKFKKCCAPGE
ncbi:MAG: hypothetical protein NVSMB9_27330 [Isosphaeraceae bacterium]